MTTPTPTPAPDDLDAVLRAVPPEKRGAALDAIRALVPPAPANDPTEPTDPTACELAPDAAQHVKDALQASISFSGNLQEFARFLILVDRFCDALDDRDTALALSDAACRLMRPAQESCELAEKIGQHLRDALGIDIDALVARLSAEAAARRATEAA